MSAEDRVPDLLGRLERSITEARAARERARCRCHESAEAWRRCPVPYHDHSKWTEHGWNCPPSCAHPDAIEARTDTGENR